MQNLLGDRYGKEHHDKDFVSSCNFVRYFFDFFIFHIFTISFSF